MSFFTRPKREPTFNEEKYCTFSLIQLKTTHPDKDKTQMRLSRIEAIEIRPGQYCPKTFHVRQDQDETSSKILYETKTRPRIEVPLVLRPRPRLSLPFNPLSFYPLIPQSFNPLIPLSLYPLIYFPFPFSLFPYPISPNPISLFTHFLLLCKLRA